LGNFDSRKVNHHESFKTYTNGGKGIFLKLCCFYPHQILCLGGGDQASGYGGKPGRFEPDGFPARPGYAKNRATHVHEGSGFNLGAGLGAAAPTQDIQQTRQQVGV
jgi:hypothetical protein